MSDVSTAQRVRYEFCCRSPHKKDDAAAAGRSLEQILEKGIHISFTQMDADTAVNVFLPEDQAERLLRGLRNAQVRELR